MNELSSGDVGMVTRLGGFPPFELLFSLGSFLKITEVGQNFGFLSRNKNTY
jgi:hypothetical protein